MCMPEYLYGLILIDSLEGQSTRGAVHPGNGFLQRESEPIRVRRGQEKSTAIPAGAGNLAPAGA
jgi:hypothetical protein